MAYELGTYSEELRKEHKQGKHRDEPYGDLDCPTCIATQSALDDWPSNEALMDSAAEMDEVTGQHATHSPANSPDGCFKCAAEAGRDGR